MPEIICELKGAKASKVSGRVLSADQSTEHNTFQQPDNVRPANFDSMKLTAAGLETILPPKSVVAVIIE